MKVAAVAAAFENGDLGSVARSRWMQIDQFQTSSSTR